MKVTLKLMLKVTLKVMQKVMQKVAQQQFEQIIQFLHNADCFILKLTLLIKEKMGMLDLSNFVTNRIKYTYILSFSKEKLELDFAQRQLI